MTLRLIHTADLHLDAPLRSLALNDPALRARVGAASREALRRIVDRALATDAVALLLAGDVFDRAEQSLHAVAFFAAQMARLHEKGVPAFMIRGNHDFENRAAARLPLPPNVHVFGPEGGVRQIAPAGCPPLAVHGVSYDRAGTPGSLLDRFGPAIPGAVNVGLLHTSLAGSGAHDPYAPCSIAALEDIGFDYWALGHIHQRAVHRERPWVVMPGSPQGRHINEPGPRSATEVMLGPDGVTGLAELPTASVVFERLEVALPADGATEPDALCRDALAACGAVLAEGQALVARVRVTGSEAALRDCRRHAALWRERAAEAVRELGAAWLEGLDFAPAAAAPAAGPVAEIVAAMRALSLEPAVRHALEAELEATLAHLRPDERRALVPDAAAAAALLERLTSEGVEEIAAALDAAGDAP